MQWAKRAGIHLEPDWQSRPQERGAVSSPMLKRQAGVGARLSVKPYRLAASLVALGSGDTIVL